MASKQQIRNWMILNRDDFDNATQLAESVLAEFPTHQDEAIAFDIAQEVFYEDCGGNGHPGCSKCEVKQ